MERLELGESGLAVSTMCFGAMLLGSRVAQQESWAMLDRYLEADGNFIDTANCYAWWEGRGEFIGDESENTLGEWMQARGNRNQIVLATKCGARLRDPHAIRDAQGVPRWAEVPQHYEYLSAGTVRAAVEASLRRLRTDRIDLLYAHIDDRRTPLEETLAAMDRLVREGKLLHIAASNLHSWRLERARQISTQRGWARYQAVQAHYSYLRMRPGQDYGVMKFADDSMLDYLAANPEVGFLAYTPLLKGLFNKPDEPETYYAWSMFDMPEARARLAAVKAVAGESGASGNQVVLAWMLQKHAPRVIPILGVSRMAQLVENLGALDLCLSAEQVARLDAAGG